MEWGKMKYIDTDLEGLDIVQYKEFEYKLEQLDRIEKKIDSILEKLNEKELSKGDY